MPPPMGREVRLFLKVCSKPRNFITDRFTVGSEAQAALVGADGAVELYAVAAVYVYLTGIVYPNNAERR